MKNRYRILSTLREEVEAHSTLTKNIEVGG